MVSLYRGKSQHMSPLKSPKHEFPPVELGGIWTYCSAHFYLNFGTKKPCIAIFFGSNRNCPGLTCQYTVIICKSYFIKHFIQLHTAATRYACISSILCNYILQPLDMLAYQVFYTTTFCSH